MSKAAYARDPRVLLDEAGIDASRGLEEAEAAARLVRDGPNRVTAQDRPRYFAIAIRQVADPLVLLLCAATAVSFAIGEPLEATAIATIVLLDFLLGYVQETRAARAVLALRERLDRNATVIRGGRQRQIPVDQVVRGDLVVLREGERVPADGRLVTSEGLEVDESLLTGESYPVAKDPGPVPEPTPVVERTPMTFAGTGVTRGHGIALVTATGDATEMGQVVRLAGGAKPPPTPLQGRLQALTRTMVAVGLAVTAALAVGMVARGEPLHEAFLVGVSVAVAAVPEGLAATVTIALSLGARAMAARGAIVKRLSAVETLGSATIVASDKTGTLTENTLRVVAVLPAEGRTSIDVLSVAALASSAELVHEDGGLRILGDPVEGALLVAAGEQGIARPELLAVRKLLREVPFDSARRSSSALYDEAGRLRAVTKGAPEVILTTRPNGNGALLIQSAEDWAGEGLRVLAVAERMLEAGGDLDEGERDFSPVGLVALDDPLRPGAADAIARARMAGLGVKILTGDHPATANAIAAALGVAPSDVHARVTPADKLRLVKELQAGGDVVVVTGDGVNDSPALRQADVGIAMGRSGTEAAREAADLVLTDDDFATIVAAVREGRAIADNVRKFVAFLLSANFGEVLLFAVTVLGGLGVPMTVAQVLVVNVLTDGLPAAALSRDPPSPETMTHGPQRSNRLFSPSLWSALGLVGTIVGAAGLGAYLAGRALGGGQAQTMAFATIALAELLLVFSCRSVRTPAWREPANGYLLLGVLLSAALLGLGVYLPSLHAPLGTVALGGAAFGIVCGLAALPFVATECAKGIARRMVG